MGTASCNCRLLLVLMLEDVIDRLADGLDLLGILVRDPDPEMIFELHDELNRVERVSVEILLERRPFGDLGSIDAEHPDNDLLDLLENLFPREPREHRDTPFSRDWREIAYLV